MYRFIHFRFIFNLLINLAFTIYCFGQNGADKPPNIIYILADDLGYGDIGILNHNSKIPTPNIDRLAGQGIIFSDAHPGSGGKAWFFMDEIIVN